MFRVIIAGGRDFDDYQLLKATMDKLLCNITDEITVVCGQAKGADTLGEQYAMEKGYAIDYYPPSGNYTASELDTYAMSRWHRTPTLWLHSGTVKVVAPST